VLVVEDSPEITAIVQRALTRVGYRVQVAGDGAEALEKIEHDPPKLILLDMRMPGMDGWEFIRRFRNQYGRLIPITVMTAAEDSAVRANQVGADSYLGKPIVLPALYEVVENTILD
jgi:CheY-like chemotaxis protein